ncbi:MAG: hypothetical protein C4542_01410 [Dehalococcoidia bacterium]|nr:MAG: hypothetical protein C4542_01410 [Dehalococcoidia bacterium]
MSDLEIEIHCPDCDAAMNVMLSQIAREESVTCPACKKVIHMKPDPKPSPEETKKLSQSFESINQAMRKLKEKP